MRASRQTVRFRAGGDLWYSQEASNGGGGGGKGGREGVRKGGRMGELAAGGGSSLAV
jgi:hypothetical protein